MPRGPRIAFADSFYHVFNRGINKQKIFFDAQDHHQFLKRLLHIKLNKSFDHSILSYVLMPNHFHLLLYIRRMPLAKIMTSLLTSYSMYFNRRYQRTGSVFQDRYKSKICDRDSYFWAASRYIMLNPIEAGLVDQLKDYMWSSYQELFGLSEYKIIDKDELVEQIGRSKKDNENYHRFILAGISDIEEERNIYGPESFAKNIAGAPRFHTSVQKKYAHRINKKKSKSVISY